MRKKIFLILTFIVLTVSITISFAEDENPKPKSTIPLFCIEHHIMDCDKCDY